CALSSALVPRLRAMSRWIILPFDNSPLARATLHRAANSVRESGSSYCGVTLAVAGIDPTDLDDLALRACVIAGPGVPLEVVLLNPGAPLGALAELVASLPDAVLATPLGAKGDTPWYREACKAEGVPCALLLFFLKPREVQKFAVVEKRRPQP